MKFPRCLAMLAALGAVLPSVVSAAEPERLVILISVDGLADCYFDDPKADMPTIRALAAEGVRAKRMECSYPTVTWTNHTTLVTGVQAGRHGVIGNNYFDRAQRKSIPFIPDPIFDKDEIVKCPTIYDVAHGAGLKTAAVIWPASRGAKTLDWTIPDVFDQALFEKHSTPSLLEEAKELGIPYWKQNEWCAKGNEGKPMRDYLYTRLASHIIQKHRPSLLLLHLVTVDSFGHATGRQSEESYWAVNDSDNRVRELLQAVEAAGLRERTTFVITADHGFITYTKTVNPNGLLIQEKLLNPLDKGLKEAKAYCLAQGGGAFFYLLDDADREARLADLKAKLQGLEGVESGTGPEGFAALGHQLPSEDPRVPDLMLSAKDGYSFSDALSPTIISEVKGNRGSHGYVATHPKMQAGFVMAGAGVKSGVVLDQITNRDVAPTMARLLGLEMKEVEGRVLTEALK